jgi:hypothetical protein
MVDMTAEEVEWAGVSLRQARDQLTAEDSNWDESEDVGAAPGTMRALATTAVDHINSLLRKLGETDHPQLRLAPPNDKP